ncbi:hypothetical protein MCOR02_011913 [Pyricularia oryzae]|uniref:Uncharacterized protein n=1 Tax=Pyricularia oryzae TaxID=318829 RepID=A0A4P7NEG5_PYROR|nr:hypothetical protein MCOR02_011913 [Pyricularia oryzae]KAI6317509.1 hypothetical protein MCOR34_003933 [Pyricularia oryzae]KAI6458470.1 hypothetical protein MCOR17_007371 [Pyricularia oryzae]KAI6577284.1 hypothetical protein MCOR04_006682 [Pyricularia oryzae]QBZ60237.1 hypothetical protein PoMZ_07175 [Pyricularia oryzae]
MSGWNVRCKIVAVCRDKVDGQTLRRFTTKANTGLRLPYEVLLFAKPDEDVRAVLNANSDASAFDLVQPLKEQEYLGKAMENFPFTYYKETYGSNSCGDDLVTSDIALIQLRAAASNKGRCFVCVSVQDREVHPTQGEPTIGFHCAFENVPAAIAGLDDLKAICSRAESARRMRDQAVMCGGVWDPHVLAKLRAAEASNPRVLRAHLDPVAFPPFVGQIQPEADAANHRGRPILTPLFVTAENVRLDTINEILTAAEQEQGQRADQKIDRYAIVSNMDPDSDFSTEGPAVPPLQALPKLPREFMHASPEACAAFARSRFPGQKQLIKWNQFVMADELTESERTVILGAHEPNHGLVLNRAAFDRAWNIQAVVEVSGQSFDMRADISSRIEDGSDREIC